ncbi:MAG: radical SAM protein [Polyangiaceae bacterium]|nr:radical SAM protein [Polyangiaceae bacterium]
MTPERRWGDEIARALFGPLLVAGAPLHGWSVVGWDAEQGLCLTLGRGDRALLFELERHDVGRECYARTARFNVCVRRTFDAAAALDPAERAVVELVLGVVRHREERLPEPERAQAGRRALVRAVEARRVLIAEGRGHYYVNPYVGCTVGCSWCYAADRADFSRALEGQPAFEWGRWVDVKVNAAEILREEVRRAAPGIVRMSPIVTDPYQPIERHHRITRQCLEVLLEASFAPVILTRGARVLDDLELLSRFRRAAVGFSIPTDDDAVRRAFEPGADPIEERLEALRHLKAAGVRTFAVVQPVLPCDPARLAGLLAPVVDLARVDGMHVPEKWDAPWEAFGAGDVDRAVLCERLRSELEHELTVRRVPRAELDDLTALVDREPPCAAPT